MASKAYFESSGGTKVYLEIDPVPMPLPVYEPIVVRKKPLNGYADGEIVPAEYDFILNGAVLSGASINVSVKQMSRAAYNSIVSMMQGVELYVFSPDATTRYRGAIAAGGAPRYIEGTNWIEWDLTFLIKEMA